MDNQIIKYYGLVNQGATCYLNSLLQVLFMTRDFKLAVKRHSRENPDSDFIDRDLDALFKYLKRKTITPYGISRKLKIERVNEPRDAAEYFEKILHLASPAASKVFSGILTHRNKCLSCQTTTETNSPFWHLPIALVGLDDNNYSVEDGINEHFKASFFNGDDQIYCDSCCAKTDFEIDCVMKHHPDVLLLLLKRFKLDHSSMKYVKIYCNVDIPHSLEIPATNQTYELYAVVEHNGDLRNGHYTATINDGKDWYLFNDATVTLISAATDVSIDGCMHHQIYTQQSPVDTWDAYLLFYKKQNDCEAKTAASCLPPTDDDVYIQCGDAGEESERMQVEVEVEVEAGVGHEVEEPGTEDLHSDGSSTDGCLNEKNEITCAQMSGEANKYGECADLKQSEKKKEQTETEEYGENRATHPRPTTSDPAEHGKNIFAENMNTMMKPQPKKKMKLAANLGDGSHQKRAAHEKNDRMTEGAKNLKKGLHVKIIEEEIRPLPKKKNERPKSGDTFSF